MDGLKTVKELHMAEKKGRARIKCKKRVAIKKVYEDSLLFFICRQGKERREKCVCVWWGCTTSRMTQSRHLCPTHHTPPPEDTERTNITIRAHPTQSSRAHTHKHGPSRAYTNPAYVC